MDWDCKEFAWDPPGLEQSNGGSGEQKNGGASVDLRLGEASDSVEKSVAETSKDSRDSKTSSSGSSKRSRMQNGSQNMTCSVDGCKSDLSNCREYHRRHRVCEKHSKTPIVLVGGKQQRFCQQCSRFHSLGEFDEVKRSCRKRLDGHNRRRRKPQPPSLFMAAEKFLSSYKGPRLLQFGNPQGYAPLVRSFWPIGAKTEAEPILYDQNPPLHSIGQQSLPNSFANAQHQQDKQVPILQGPKAGYANEVVPGIPFSQEISIAPLAGGKAGQKLSSDGKPESFDSGCALYLLSTLQTQNSESTLVQSNITFPTQSTPDVHFDAVNNHSGSGSVKDKAAAPVFVLDANAANVHCNGMLRMGPDGLVDAGDLLTLPFLWE